MFGLLKDICNKESMKKSFDGYKKQYPELSKDLDWEDVEPKSYDGIEDLKKAASLYEQWKYEGESPKVVTSGYPQWDCYSVIDFNTLNALTKDYYSPQARVKRMLQHAKVAAEKGSWWCNIPEVSEEEVALLKDLGFRVYSKQVRNRERFDSTYPEYVTQFSLNWADVKPDDTSLTEV